MIHVSELMSTTTAGEKFDYQQQITGAYTIPSAWLNESAQGSRLIAFGDYTPPSSPVGNFGPNITSTILPSIGNGYIATQWTSSILYVAGLFRGTPKTSGTVPTVNRLGVPSGASLTIAHSVVTLTALDMMNGIIEEQGYVGTDMGTVFRRTAYAHRACKNLLVVELSVNGPSSKAVELDDEPFQQFVTKGSKDITLTRALGTINNSEVVTGAVQVWDVDLSPIKFMAVCRDLPPKYLVANNKLTIMSAYVTGSNESILEDLGKQACQLLDDARKNNSVENKLWQAHSKQWNDLWDRGVQVTGSPGLARLMNATMYAILISVRDDVFFSVSPGGLSTSGYGGHVFWDMDTWIFPTLNLFHPALADAHLQFRKNGITGAKAKAQHFRQQGLMFPWEATPAGFMASLGGDEAAEPHVTGDVALAFWNRYRATGDLQELFNSFPVLEGVADFWSGRASCEVDVPQCYYECVTGPDEFNTCKSHEVFTTALAKTIFSLVRKAALKLQLKPKNMELWASTQARLSIDLMHPPGGAVNAAPVTQCYKNYSGEAVMQPSVADVGYPLMWNVNSTQREIDLNYYWRRTSGFIAGMVWPSVAIGYNEVNNTANAALFFQWAYGTVQPPFNVVTEEAGGAGCANFITGAGGILQSVWAGWGGTRLRDDRLDFLNPMPPPGADSLKLAKINYFGNTLDVTISSNQTEVRLLVSTATYGVSTPLSVVCGSGVPEKLIVNRNVVCRTQEIVSVLPVN